MKFVIAALAAAYLLAAAPAVAATAVCTAKDSAGRHWTEKTSGLLEFSVKTMAGASAKADCRYKSKHPHTCKIDFCTVTR